MATKLDTLKEQLATIAKAIEDEEKRIAAGGSSLDTTIIERKMDDIVGFQKAEIQELKDLNIEADRTYAKLEELSLRLLNALALGMPLLEKANR